jgi:hypothetical protein
MRAAFVLTASEDPTGYVAADFCLRSIRRAMPDVEVVQLTDETSPGVVGVDRVDRRPAAPFAAFIAEHYAAAGPGEWLFLDTDVVVQRDVRAIFAARFDLALADRAGTYLPGEEGSEFMTRCPYNAGVVFSRNHTVWQAVAARIAAMSPDDQAWLGVQLALGAMIRDALIFARILPAEYNYPPQSAEDDVRDKALVHYKGPWRKRALIDRIYRETVVRPHEETADVA